MDDWEDKRNIAVFFGFGVYLYSEMDNSVCSNSAVFCKWFADSVSANFVLFV